MFFLVVQGY